MIQRRLAAPAALIAALFAGGDARAGVMITFERIDPGNAPFDIASQLKGDASEDGGAGTTSFKFFNIGPISSYIGEIQFEDLTNTLFDFGSADIDGSSGVKFMPSNPFGGVGVFKFDDYAAAKDGGGNGVDNGINEASAEWVSITFNLLSGQTYSNVLQALTKGDLRIAMHLQSIGDEDQGQDYSDKFVNTPTVPEPGSLALLATGGLGLVGGWYRKRRKTAVAA